MDAPRSSRLNLARKYRPRKLSELLGQDSLVKILQQAIHTDRIAPAYLFSGPRGVGKTSSARIFAQAAICLDEDPTNRACGSCSACKAFLNGQLMDILEIDGASHTGVDDVRQIIESVAYKPSLGRRSVFIIDEVHMLSNAAFNALLKTLEEPPPHVLFLFATTESERLPGTILSRVQRLELRKLSERLIVDSLKEISKLESIKAHESVLQQIASAADGALRDAQTLLEQMKLLGGEDEIPHEVVDQFLGTIGTDQEIQLIEMIAQRDLDGILEKIDRYHEKAKDLSKLSHRLLEWIRCLILARHLRKRDLIEKDLAPEHLDRLVSAFSSWSAEDLERLFDVFVDTVEKMKRSLSPKMSLESGFIRACRIVHTKDLQDLIVKLESQLKVSELRPLVDKLPSSKNLPPPQRPATKAPAPPPAEERVREVATDTKSLLEQLKESKRSLYALIRCHREAQVNGSTWALEFPKEHFALKQLREENFQKELQSFVREASQGKITSIQLIEKGEDTDREAIMKRDFIKEAKKEILNDQIVSEALQKIKGQVDSVTVEGIKT